MPFFDGPITRKLPTDAPTACGSCHHDQCSCDCAVCREHQDNPERKECGCYTCARDRADT